MATSTTYSFDGTITKTVNGVAQYTRAMQNLISWDDSTAAPSPSPSPSPAPSPPDPGIGDTLANEYQKFNLSRDAYVSFGYEDSGTSAWVSGVVPAGTNIACEVGVVPGGDPLPGFAKRCRFDGFVSSTPPAPAPAPSVPSGLDATAMKAKADLIGTESWIDMVKGPAASGSVANGTLLPEPTHTPIPSAAQGMSGTDATYEMGGPVASQSGNYCTGQGDFIGLGAPTNDGSGVRGLQTTSYVWNLFSFKPQKKWQVGFNPDGQNIALYKSSGFLPSNTSLAPIFTSSVQDGFDHDGGNTVIIYKDGKVVTCGRNTASNAMTATFPSNKQVCSGGMTSCGQFMGVGVIDKDTGKSQVAIVALAGRADGVDWTNTTEDEDWWNEWRYTYPLMPNQGNIAFFKILGYVDLPDGFGMPSVVKASTGFHPWKLMILDHPSSVNNPGTGMCWANSPIQSHLDDLRGKYASGFSRGGAIVAGSVDGGKVCIIDVKPLISWALNSYLAGDGSAAAISAIGMGNNQFPQVFSVSGVTCPIVKTLDMGVGVGGIYISGTNQSTPYIGIATVDGKFQTYSMGNYLPGNKTGVSGAPSQIVKMGECSGLGPVSDIAPARGLVGVAGGGQEQGCWFVSRSERAVGYVKCGLDGSNPTIGKKIVLNSSQCADPVSIWDGTNYYQISNMVQIMGHNDQKITQYQLLPMYQTDYYPGSRIGTTQVNMNGDTRYKYDIPAEGGRYMGAYLAPFKPHDGRSGNVP